MNSLISLLLLGLFAGAALASHPLNVTSVEVLGNLSDTHLAHWTLQRDGGAIGSLDGVILIYFCDTDYFYNGTWSLPFYDNTVSVGHYGQPLNVTTPMKYGVPYTAEENAYNSLYGSNPRMVLWPQAGVVQVGPNDGILMVKKAYSGSAKKTNKTTNATYYVPTPDTGVVLCNVTIAANGDPVTVRTSNDPIFGMNGFPTYGALAATNDSTYMYLYSSDQIGSSGTYNIHVARATFANARNASMYEFYNKSSNTWGSVQPLASDVPSSIISVFTGISCNIIYSQYLGLWLMGYGTGGDVVVHLTSAPNPEGPWIVSSHDAIYRAPMPNGNAKYIYDVTVTDLYDNTGRTVQFLFSWAYDGGYANWVISATLE